MMIELHSMMSHRIMNMETYKEKAGFLETVYDTLNMTGQLTEDLEDAINEQWDSINKEFEERCVNRAVCLIAI